MPQRSEQILDMPFPLGGIDQSDAYSKQEVKDLGGRKVMTTFGGVNVRSFDPAGDRMRGGSRPGLGKFRDTPVVASYIVQDLATLISSAYGPPGGSVPQYSNSGRVVTVVAVCQGNVYTASAGDTAWTAATNNTGDSPPLNITGVMFSSENNQRLWFADGVNWVYYDPRDNTVNRWSASAGLLPVDAENNTPRLICTWRGRTVLSGLLKDPQNWFMSAVSDPTDFDYSPQSTSATQAVAGNNAPQGFIGDLITSLVPYTDDILLFGGDHTIYMLRGDPMAGGQIDLITDAIGMAWGQAWCKDPYGTLYFFSNRCGIYSLVPGQQPVRVSQPIENLVRDVDTGTNGIRLVWDDRYQGLHVFISPLQAPAATTHYFMEQRSGAWWQDQFTDTDHDPLALCVFDGNLPTDRVVLLGSWDGYVRTLSEDNDDDDGTAISSSVYLGPILSAELDEFLLKDLQAVLSESSGDITYSVYVGATPEAALASAAVATGTWSASRNLNSHVRWSGHAVYVKITSTSQWALEQIRCRFAPTGKVRRRGF